MEELNNEELKKAEEAIKRVADALVKTVEKIAEALNRIDWGAISEAIQNIKEVQEEDALESYIRSRQRKRK